MNRSATSETAMESLLRQSREASYRMAVLSTEDKNRALEAFASLIEDNIDFLLEENRKDLEKGKEEVSPSLYQRLKLDSEKLYQLVHGIRDVVKLPDPVGRTLWKVKMDEGLILEKITVPIGVIGIIFESRPDVIPQILSLVLKSGNATVLKGGKEAHYSNHAFMKLADDLNQQFSLLPKDWAKLLDSRQAVQEMLAYHQYVDLLIPRGSNQLVQSVMASTRIPVLGHADGVCHLYVHSSANITKAAPVVIDAKAQYPAACNALETLLVDEAIAGDFLPLFAKRVFEKFPSAASAVSLRCSNPHLLHVDSGSALLAPCSCSPHETSQTLSKESSQAGIVIRGCEKVRAILPGTELANEEDWRTEYGDLTLSVKIVSNLDEAVDHINHYGSHHTDGILAEDAKAQEIFLNRVDSASVFSNASTRFADGFRFGLGAEIGISTAKTHARGPVGMEGLVIYKYKLRGSGQIVSDYVGNNPKPFLHEPF